MDYNLRLLKAHRYSYNVAILKSYGNVGYQLIQMNCVRNKGVECDTYTEKCTVNDTKLLNNITRARSTVRQYGLCNAWQYFVTLTFNQELVDRYNLPLLLQKVSQWIRDYRKKYGFDILYVLIPEQHKDGAWHMHGFIMGLPAEHIKLFTLAEHLPDYIRKKLIGKELVYNWPAYADKFGHVTIEPIRSHERAVNYILKYINKDLERSVTTLGAHLFYASQHLQKAQEIKRGTLTEQFPVDFENEYCKVTWFNSCDYNRNYLQDCIINSHNFTEVNSYDFATSS